MLALTYSALIYFLRRSKGFDALSQCYIVLTESSNSIQLTGMP